MNDKDDKLGTVTEPATPTVPTTTPPESTKSAPDPIPNTLTPPHRARPNPMVAAKVLGADSQVKVQNVNPNTSTVVGVFREYRDNLHGEKPISLATIGEYQRKLNNALGLLKSYQKPAEIIDCVNRLIELIKEDLTNGHKDKSAFTVMRYNRALGAVGKDNSRQVLFISHFMRVLQLIAERGKGEVRKAYSMDVFTELTTNPIFNKTFIRFVNGSGK